jgi:hypothetical protein
MIYDLAFVTSQTLDLTAPYDYFCLAQRYTIHRARQEDDTNSTILVIFVFHTLESAVGELDEFMDRLVTVY